MIYAEISNVIYHFSNSFKLLNPNIDLTFILLISPAEGLWSGLSPDRTHRGEQVQHLRIGRVAQQEEAHVRGTEHQREADEGEENPKEKHSHSLPAHCGTATMMGHIGRPRAPLRLRGVGLGSIYSDNYIGQV